MPFPTPHITNIKLLSGVPLDASYRHSIYFASEGAQAGYFAGQVVSGLSWADCMYHRENASIRVNAPIEDCEGVNYAMFQNTAYGSKWFYAFVTEHTYINANCTELKIELDVLQTYFFDSELQPGYIERNHVSQDRIGEHIAPEGLDTGEYMKYDYQTIADPNEWDVVMWSSFQPTNVDTTAGGDISTGLFSALDRNVIGRVTINDFNSPNWTLDPRVPIKALVEGRPEKVDGLIAITMSPRLLGITNDRVSIPLKANALSGGYQPRNKKLYSAPFNVMLLNNGETERVLAPNFFSANGRFVDGQNVTFLVKSDKAPCETIVCVPLNYGGGNSSYPAYNAAEYITLTGFPQCAWVSDAFKTYLAQNASSLALSAGMSAIKIVGGVAIAAGTGTAGAAFGASLIGSAAGDVASLASTGATLIDLSKQAPVNHGNITGTALLPINAKGIFIYYASVRADVAARIDDYFDLYGYAIREIGRPHLNNRPHWSYVKMQNAFVKPTGAGCPAEALVKIQNIYNAGITFWKNASEVGDYSLDNRV